MDSGTRTRVNRELHRRPREHLVAHGDAGHARGLGKYKRTPAVSYCSAWDWLETMLIYDDVRVLGQIVLTQGFSGKLAKLAERRAYDRALRCPDIAIRVLLLQLYREKNLW